MTARVEIVALGGLGEIGMNCMAIETDENMLVVDCGVLFPERSDIGIDVVIPDFQHLRDHREKLRGVVLTHGHEDHIGALPYFLREFRVPVYGPRYALGLVADRLKEHNLDYEPELIETHTRQRFFLGDVEVEPVDVTHSIADATSLVFRTKLGTFVHSGDFLIDNDPPEGALFDRARFESIGRDENVRLLMSDSTNVDVFETRFHEKEVARRLDALIATCPERVVVALFASNVFRIGALFEVAKRTGRRVCLLGRSVQTHVRIAHQSGHIPDPAPLLIEAELAQDWPRSRLLAIASGTQGEPGSALSRLGFGTHPFLKLEAGDTAVFSSRVIPGNERPVQHVIDALERQSVDVRFHVTDEGIHASGHASRSDQAEFIEMLRPQAFLPIHGNFHHMTRHRALAQSLGIADALLAENGQVVEVSESEARISNNVPVGRIAMQEFFPIPADVLKERSVLAAHGLAVVVVQRPHHGEAIAVPLVYTRGILGETASHSMLAEAAHFASQAVRSSLERREVPTDEELAEHVRRAVRRYFFRKIGRKPPCQVLIVG